MSDLGSNGPYFVTVVHERVGKRLQFRVALTLCPIKAKQPSLPYYLTGGKVIDVFLFQWAKMNEPASAEIEAQFAVSIVDNR